PYTTFFQSILRIIHTEGFSRLPVFRDTIDQISGVLHVKDLLPQVAQLERLSVPGTDEASETRKKEFLAIIERSVRPALYISETQSLPRLLYEFQRSRMHMGIVVSEHGGV